MMPLLSLTVLVSFVVLCIINPKMPQGALIGKRLSVRGRSSAKFTDNSSTQVTSAENCTLWFVYNNSTKQCECGNDVEQVVLCDDQIKAVYILDCNCMTHDVILGTVVGSCLANCEVKRSNRTLGYYNKLPSLVNNLNEEMCERRWNRTGRFCSQCKEGHYLSVYSYDLHCIQCSDSELKRNWSKYIAFAYGPLTIFYIVVLVLGINANHPRVVVLIIYAQAIASPENLRIAMTAAVTHPQAFPVLYTVATLCGMWNLDFFRIVLPSTCLKVNTLQALTLDYAIALYPQILIVITYILIKLYDRGCTLVVCLWKPIEKCFKAFRSHTDHKSTVVNAFGTFLLLSYIKLLSTTSAILIPVIAYDTRGRSVGKYLFYDASVEYFGKEHLYYALIALVVMATFIILPVLVLLVYPLRCFKWLKRWPILQLSLDTYQGYYKDGTDGTTDCRWFSCSPLVVRLYVFFALSFVKNSCLYIIVNVGCLCFVALYIFFQPFKKEFAKYNTINILLLLTCSAWVMTLICVDISSFESVHMAKFSLVMTLSIGLLPLFYAWCLLLIFVYKHVKNCVRNVAAIIKPPVPQ